jgi:hypothetical protein
MCIVDPPMHDRHPRSEASVTVLSHRWRVTRPAYIGALLVISMLGLALAALAPTAASAATAKVGYVRLAHLSPDTPDVDVYLDSVSSSAKEQVFPGVGYGVMSPYLSLRVGEYAVSMRVAGANPKSPPVITTDVVVAAGQAYTVAGVGRHADLGLKVFHDDLSSPAHGKAKVRIIQASIEEPQLNVSLTNGTKIASNVAFATTTSYRQVPAGNWTLVVAPASGRAPAKLHVDLKPNNVYSLLILDRAFGGGPGADGVFLAADLKLDAASGKPPNGAVQTGLGGSAPRTMPTAAVSVLAFAGVALGGIAIASRRRSGRRLVAARAPGGRKSDQA